MKPLSDGSNFDRIATLEWATSSMSAASTKDTIPRRMEQIDRFKNDYHPLLLPEEDQVVMKVLWVTLKKK